MSQRAWGGKDAPIKEIDWFVAWLTVDNGGHERLMVGIDDRSGVAITLLAFDEETGERVDRIARKVVKQTGRPGRKVFFQRGEIAGEII